MHSNCRPIITTSATGRKFHCSGGEVKPRQHDRLWVRLPTGFQVPQSITELHDKLLAMFPNGGAYKLPAEKTAMAAINVQVPAELYNRLDAYCARKGYARGRVVRALLELVFAETDDAQAQLLFNGWRDDADTPVSHFK